MKEYKYPEERKSEYLDFLMKKFTVGQTKKKKDRKPFLNHHDLYVDGTRRQAK